MDWTQNTLFIDVNDQDRLAVERFCGDENGEPVVMVHGSVENGKIFYSSSGKGLAPYLAQEGYDVFVLDLRGKGRSTPPVSKAATYGQYEAISEDIPAVLNLVKELKGTVPVHLMAHSWGGVLLLSWFARFHTTQSVLSMVFWGTKRKIYIKTLRKFFMVDIMWNLVGQLATAFYGYLPARVLRFGSDNEPRNFFRATNRWVYSNSWIDQKDQLNYKKRLAELNVPPVLSLTGSNDHTLGNPNDVKCLLKEAGLENSEYREIGVKFGNKHDYGHIDLLTHPDAPEDHFPLVLEWLKKHTRD